MSQLELDYCQDKLIQFGSFEGLNSLGVDLCDLDDYFQNIGDLDFKGSDELTNVQIDDLEQTDFQQQNFEKLDDLAVGDHVIQIHPSRGKPTLVQGTKVYPPVLCENANNVQHVDDVGNANNAQNMHEQYSVCNVNNVQNVNNVCYVHNQYDANNVHNQFNTDGSLMYSCEPPLVGNVYDAHVEYANNYMHVHQRHDNGLTPRISNLNPSPMKRRSSRYRAIRSDFASIYGNFFGDKRNHALKPSLFSNDPSQRRRNMHDGFPRVHPEHVMHDSHSPHDHFMHGVHNAHPPHPHYMHDMHAHDVDPHYVHPTHFVHPEFQNQFQGQKVPSDFSQNNGRIRSFLEYDEAEFEGILSRFESADPRRAFLRELFQRKISRSSESDLCSPVFTPEFFNAQNNNNNNNNNKNDISDNKMQLSDQNIAQENSGKSEEESLFVSRLISQIQQQAKDPKIVANVENKSMRRISSKKKRIQSDAKKSRAQKA